MQKRAPAMAEHGVVSDDELMELSFSYSLESIGNTHTANDNNNNTQFVFSIEPSLLIDPRNVKIGRVIGEGPNSTVYEGLWVPLFSLKELFFTCFLLYYFCLF